MLDLVEEAFDLIARSIEHGAEAGFPPAVTHGGNVWCGAGLLDAAALAETLCTQAAAGFTDPGDATVLRRFERWRKSDNLLTLGMLQAIHHLFTSRVPQVPALAGAGLGVVDALLPVKRRFADYAMGRVSGAPRSARVGL